MVLIQSCGDSGMQENHRNLGTNLLSEGGFRLRITSKQLTSNFTVKKTWLTFFRSYTFRHVFFWKVKNEGGKMTFQTARMAQQVNALIPLILGETKEIKG